MLNNDIDIAVHSLKDVPTLLPKGIVQAAVLKRGNIRDTLVFKNNEEFLSQKDAVIGTGRFKTSCTMAQQISNSYYRRFTWQCKFKTSKT